MQQNLQSLKRANEFEEILEELYMYRDAGGDAAALADTDFKDMLGLIHHKGEDWSYSDLQAAIDLVEDFLNSKVGIY